MHRSTPQTQSRVMKLTTTWGVVLIFLCLCYPETGLPQTVALWLFDEPVGLYASSALDDSGPNDYPLVLGLGGKIVPGRFGNALEPTPQSNPDYPVSEDEVRFGLTQLPTPPGRTVEPMSWMNAKFAALMTSGENHLRKEVGFANATQTKLNLGAFDWTVEFWFQPLRQGETDGVVFEIGRGPRGENGQVTRLLLQANARQFVLFNAPSSTELVIPTNLSLSDWHHCAFSYAAAEQQLRHYLDGQLQPLPEQAVFNALEFGDEAYVSVGRDGMWHRPLPGRLDELRISEGQIYTSEFEPPFSFSSIWVKGQSPSSLSAGPPLLFASGSLDSQVVSLGGRRHLFIDDALIKESANITFVANQPRLAECVLDSIQGPFRKHLSIIEDEEGLIRMYNGGPDDYLMVHVSRDGVHWEKPDLGRGQIKGLRNIVLPEQGGVGSVFRDPNAPPESRWKYVSGYHRRGIYLYSSPDGWSFERHKTAVLPFRSGSQSNVFYDDQRQLYVGFHRSDCSCTPGRATQRTFVMTETDNLLPPWPFQPVSGKEPRLCLRYPQPWFLDNGPLTPGGFCQEYPVIFAPIDTLDPVGTDIYVPKAVKYPWAPDTYLAFPIVYFHYEKDGPPTRRILMHPDRERGSGPIETQLSVSRDGVHWHRYPRPAYVGIGQHAGNDFHQAYMAHGLVRRGGEIWQYYFGTNKYHSTWLKDKTMVREGVYRVVQRLDGFVSVDTPYDRIGTLTTRILEFTGNRLVLNIDTEATGYAQVGFLDAAYRPIPGFSVGDCIYINGDFIETEVEWLNKGKDLSELAGQALHVIFRMRGAKLYAMQFVER